MNTILTILRKELKVALRDRKTLISAILMPALLVPLLIVGITKLQSKLSSNERSRTLKVVLLNAPEAVTKLFTDPKIQMTKGVNLADARDSVSKESFDAVLEFEPAFTNKLNNVQTGTVNLYYKSTNEKVEDRLSEKLEQYEETIVDGRLMALNITREVLKPVKVEKVDLASTKEQIGVMIGGFIPYFFILFCFLGCMYPAIDMMTGEKEKGTIETLLTVPASRLQILMGKMIAIALLGISAALMTFAGMGMALALTNGIPDELLKVIQDVLSFRFILMLLAMLIPLSIFFAGILSAIAIRASTFKEAQSYITPMTFVVIVPAMIALMPGVKLSWQTVFVPILNIALATKEIIAGTMNTLQYVCILASLLLLAFLSVLFSVKQFSSEKNILK